MRYGSVCSGIESASVAWKDLDWQAQWFCEFDDFPSAVLKERFPDIPNLGDMTKIEESDIYNDRAIDLLVGGTPCQGFSIAGNRDGLDDERSQLSIKYCEILAQKQPRWFIWENVPGVLSSDEGKDFGTIITKMGECGYGLAYRILDAQYFGVPQRRRRVFVVGYLGDWRPATAVLFEQESLSGNFKESKKKRETITNTNAKCLTARGAGGENFDPETANYIVESPICFKPRSTESGQKQPCVLASGNNKTGSILASCGEKHFQGNQEAFSGDYHVVNENTKVIRRLTPKECERLQGFPDNWTKVPYRGKPSSKCPDGPRYKTCGNSKAAPVIQWIGERIDKVDRILN